MICARGFTGHAGACAGWDQEVPLEYTRELSNYLANDYEWRRFESKLNSWPQF